MEFVSRITKAFDSDQSIQELTESLEGEFDLGIVFVCPENAYNPTTLYQALKQHLRVRHLLLCTAAGIIGTNSEIEGHGGASLILARLPGVSVDPVYINQVTLDQLNSPEAWYEYLDIYPNEKPSFFFFPDPFNLTMQPMLDGLNKAYPGSVVVGGLASSASAEGGNTLILDSEIYHEGAIGFCLRGNVTVETVVSQGCRPIGETYIITKGHDNVIFELAGRPFLSVLEELLKQSNTYDQQLANEAIFIGLVIDEYKEKYQRGDFLIRSVMGIDPEKGAGVIGDVIKPGQMVQFHLRDAKAATQDMHELLKAHKLRMPNQNPVGALVFSCNGRGMDLFKDEHHDISVIQHHVGLVPAAGFFCSGEIGPIGGKNFLHGFTNSMALFYPKNV